MNIGLIPVIFDNQGKTVENRLPESPRLPDLIRAGGFVPGKKGGKSSLRKEDSTLLHLTRACVRKEGLTRESSFDRGVEFFGNKSQAVNKIR